MLIPPAFQSLPQQVAFWPFPTPCPVCPVCPSPSPIPTPTTFPTPSPTSSPLPTSTPIPTPTPTNSPVPTSSPPTPTPMPTPIPTSSPIPTPTPTPQPTAVPSATPTTPPASPSPVPTATSTNWSAPNDYPPYTWTPYAPSPNSVWNTPFQTNPSQADPKSASYSAFYAANYNFLTQALSFGYKNQANQYQHPIYFGYGSDPVYKVKCLASWAQQTCPTTSFHIPSYAVPSGGGDAHLAVIDYTYSPARELDTWATNPLSGTGGTITAQSAVSDPLNGTGLNTSVGAVGGGYSLWAGVIRPQELIAGQINHALFLVTPCASNLSVYPSIPRSSDSFCAQGVPYGARFRLNMTPSQISALQVPQYHKTILTALALYGAYQGDNNNTGLNFQTEADSTYSAPGYTNLQCPNNGAPCTPLTAWFNVNAPSTWDGTAYRIDISNDVPLSAWQWLLPPAH